MYNVCPRGGVCKGACAWCGSLSECMCACNSVHSTVRAFLCAKLRILSSSTSIKQQIEANLTALTGAADALYFAVHNLYKPLAN